MAQLNFPVLSSPLEGSYSSQRLVKACMQRNFWTNANIYSVNVNR